MISSDGPGTKPRHYDGTYFNPIDAVIEKEWDLIEPWLKKHVPRLSVLAE